VVAAAVLAMHQAAALGQQVLVALAAAAMAVLVRV
jgi:hypothetical protein